MRFYEILRVNNLGGFDLHFIEKEVIRLVSKHNTRDPFELCRLENINCYINDMHNDMNGIYHYHKRNKYVYINNNLSERNQTFTCGHELGHAVLHPKGNCAFLKSHTYLNTDKYEKQANMFLSVLMIEKITKEMFHEKTLDEVACEFNVPVELVALRIEVAKCGGYF